MSPPEFEPWEPEESIGKLWHSFVSKLEAPRTFEDAVVTLEDVRGRLGILFRGLGGARDVEMKPAATQASGHRLSWRRALGHNTERAERASFDGETLRLPARISAFADRDANVALYIWLAASSVFARAPIADDDPLRADIRALQAAQAMTRATLAACAGLRRTHAALVVRTREARSARSLPRHEAAVEEAILHLLGGGPPTNPLAKAVAAAVRSPTANLSAFEAPRRYRPYMPVLLWSDIRELEKRAQADRNGDEQHAPTPPDANDQEQRTLRANRKNADQAARKDSLVLHKFESILSWAEFLNINRRIDDDDATSAKKAADDQIEVNLARVPQRDYQQCLLPRDQPSQRAHVDSMDLPCYDPQLTNRKSIRVDKPQFSSYPPTDLWFARSF